MGNGKIVKRENRFTMVSNSVLQDPDLSLKAIGLYSKINSYLTITEWTLYKSFLERKCKEGQRSFDKAWKELLEAGYLIMRKIKGEDGKFYYEYELLDEKKSPSRDGRNDKKLPLQDEKPPLQNVPLENVPLQNVPLQDAGGGKCTPAKRGSYNNTDFNNTLNNNTLNNNTYESKKDTRTGFEENCNHMENKNMCVDNHSYLENLQKEIKNVIGEKIGITKLKEILRTVSIERLSYHLENWNIHKNNQVKSGAGYFITVVVNDIEPRETEKKIYNQNKVPQRDAFEQREYSDEYLESFYANLT